MDCERAVENLSCYLDQEIEAELRREVERHLDRCPDCRLHLEELTRNRDLLAALPRMRLPGDLYARVRKRIAAHARPRAAAIPSPLRRLPRGLRAAAAAAVVLLASLVALAAIGYYSDHGAPAVPTETVVTRHVLESGSPLLGDTPLWTTVSLVGAARSSPEEGLP